MEPVRGGRLARPPETVAKLWASSTRQRSPAEWALQWVWNQPEASVVLSGMTTMEQVMENVASTDHSGVGTLTLDELVLIDRAREAYLSLIPIPCTSCGYCMPCPNGVDIPRIFTLYNDAIIYNDPKFPRIIYGGAQGFKEEQRADKCIDCGDCLELCPQEIPITECLKKAHRLLSTI